MVGRDITEPEHAFLKAMMQNYINDCEPIVMQHSPVEHKYICDSCAQEKSGKGTNFHMKMKKVAKRNKLPKNVETTNN